MSGRLPNKITSIQNDKIRHVRKLLSDKDYRYACKEYVIEGVRSLEDNQSIKELFICEGIAIPDIKCYNLNVLSRDVFKKISLTENSQGVVAISTMKVLNGSSVRQKARYILLDKLQDPGNAGTIIRTACGFGIDGVIITDGCVDPFSPKTARSAMGGLQKLDVIKINQISDLKDCAIIAADAKGGDVSKFKWPESFILAIGGEAHGISGSVKEAAKHTVAVQISGIESLNAAICAGILLYDWNFKLGTH